MNATLNFLRGLPRAHRRVFLFAFVAALLFAVCTNHVWEDYYITFRSSKNLATGHGLVFNRGDRLHTFTSPLGVLLPALASVLTLNRSDTAALWLFRLMSAAAFAGAATLLYASVIHLHRHVLVAVLAVAWLVLDAKSLDFTINGMETGFFLLFVAWTLWAQFGDCPRRWLWLGLGWAGLMWTRPDGFIYIGLLALGGFLFNDRARTGLTRIAWLKIFVLAGLVCTAVYLPWFAGSWLYYGTPVPHTITAKASMSNGLKTPLGALETLVHLPIQIWTGSTSVPAAFLPSYYLIGGWPAWMVPFAAGLAFIAAFAWLAPFFSGPTRTASFAFCGLHVYLTYFPYFPFPWYLPATTLLGYFAFAGIAAETLAGARLLAAARPEDRRPPRLRLAALVFAAALVSFNLWTTFAVARQVAAQQTWVETGNRRKIGEWLRLNAAPGDSVFLEPLGYIGYFSNLKTYDFPGMSSREMVEATRRYGADWAVLVEHLKPQWLVLRPHEALRMQKSRPRLLSRTYRPVRDFSVLDEVKKLDVRGRAYLEFDARFRVYHLAGADHPLDFGAGLIETEAPPSPLKVIPPGFREIRAPFPVSIVTIGTRQMRLIHAPSLAFAPIPPGARHVRIAFAFPPAAYEEPPKTDGATFEIKWLDGPRQKILLTRDLDPVAEASDRGLQFFEAELPAGSAHAELCLRTDPGDTNTKDWTCWSIPEFW